jgi:hypothetical protein
MKRKAPIARAATAIVPTAVRPSDAFDDLTSVVSGDSTKRGSCSLCLTGLAATETTFCYTTDSDFGTVNVFICTSSRSA